jgi:hypothetical protein
MLLLSVVKVAGEHQMDKQFYFQIKNTKNVIMDIAKSKLDGNKLTLYPLECAFLRSI